MLNSLERLRLDVQSLCNYNVHLIPLEKAEAYGLFSQSPAQVTNEGIVWQIFILESLSNEERLEAEAHELGHLLVYYRPPGLITMDSIVMFDEDIHVLICRIDNAISHKLLIDELETNYNISSGLHIQLMETSLEDIRAEIRNLVARKNNKLLQAMGVYLFDIARTNMNASARVDQKLQLNTTVKHAFKSAQLHLSQIKLGQSQTIQHQYVNKFMKAIGYQEELDYFLL
ncbi:hypothetical protein [Bacillus sp. 1NLA3E]|uniref:hypothetical protein n=1 Tax=Bacillus sp. 1NLA3E TaxID=666686 RepID=UPI000247F2EC|nr:hypothetical protein [Bacillus sp. 1NLA3E]AGK54066.1 hypothetical protein B1NLA3E_11580 [Bacillus sp. 1NLA3E]